MIREASDQGMLTCPYVLNEDDARGMVEAGADVVVSHMELTTSGDIGAETALDLETAAERVQVHHDAATEMSEDVMVNCHGGPIAWPDNAVCADGPRVARGPRLRDYRVPCHWDRWPRDEELIEEDVIDGVLDVTTTE